MSAAPVVAALLLGLAMASCGRTTTSSPAQIEDALASLDFGRVAVGLAATHFVTLPAPLDSGRRYQLRFAPDAIDVAPELTIEPGPQTQLRVTWQPQQLGPLDVSLIYQSRSTGSARQQPSLLRIELRGEAVDGSRADPTPCGIPGDPSCDDQNPCTRDSCLQGSCLYEPMQEGQPCGPFDCRVGHYCVAGTCSQVELSNVSEGMTCDDGDPCTTDGECRDGLCYASTDARPVQVVQSLPTYGYRPVGMATDGRSFVYAMRTHLDLAELEDGRLEHRARVPLQGAYHLLAVELGSFLVRTTTGEVSLLDTRSAENPQLKALGHIVPRPVPTPEGKTVLSVSFHNSGIWAVQAGMVLIPTETRYVGEPATYHLTQAPIDPAQGQAEALDVHGFRLAAARDVIAYALPGYGTDGSQGVGIVGFGPDGLRRQSHLSVQEAAASGCGRPRYVGAHGQLFATLADEDGSGFGPLCIFQIEESGDGFELLGARLLREHVHGCSVAIDATSVYVGCGWRYEGGWLGALVATGETIRFDIEEFISDSSAIRFRDGQLISHRGDGHRTAVESGYLLAVRELGLALDLTDDYRPLQGAGLGSFVSLIPGGAEGRFLLGGRATFGVLEVSRAQPPELSWGDSRIHAPVHGQESTDVRILRQGRRVANINGTVTGHPQKDLHGVIAQLDPEGLLSLEQRVWEQDPLQGRSAGAGAGHIWLHGGEDPQLKAYPFDDAQAEPVAVSTTGSVLAPGTHLRADASGERMVLGSPHSFALLDPAQPPEQLSLEELGAANDYVGELSPHEPSFHQTLLVLDEDRVLLGSSLGVELHDRHHMREPVLLELPELDPLSAVAIPWYDSAGRALVSYLDTDGVPHLLQISIGPFGLEPVAELDTDERVTGAEPSGEHFILLGQSAVLLAQLACWPDAP